MPIKAQITKESVGSFNEIQVHFIPAAIDGNGTMNIDEYFNKYNMEQDGSKFIKYE